MEAVADRCATLGPDILRGLVAHAPDRDPGPRSRTAIPERGEIPAADLPDRVLTGPTSLLRHEMPFTREPTAPSTLTGIVDDVFLPLVSGKRERSE